MKREKKHMKISPTIRGKYLKTSLTVEMFHKKSTCKKRNGFFMQYRHICDTGNMTKWKYGFYRNVWMDITNNSIVSAIINVFAILLKLIRFISTMINSVT